MTTVAHAGEWGDDGDFVYSLHTATNHSRASFSGEEESSLWEEEETSSEYETDYETDSEDDAPASPAEMKSEVSFRPNNETSTVAFADRARLSRSALIARALERAKKKKAEEQNEVLVYSLRTASTHSIRSSFSEDDGSGDSSEYETDYSDEETDSEYEADSSDDEIDSSDDEEEEAASVEKEALPSESSLLLDKMGEQLNKMMSEEARAIGLQRTNESSLVADSLLDRRSKKTTVDADAKQRRGEEEEANSPSMTELVAKALKEAKWKKIKEEEDDDNDFLYPLHTASGHSASSLPDDDEGGEPLSWEQGEKELYRWELDTDEEADAPPEAVKLSPADDSGVGPESENESAEEEEAASAEAERKIEAEEEDNYGNDFVYSLHTATNHSTESPSDGEESWEGENESYSREEGQEISPLLLEAHSDEEAHSPEAKRAPPDDSGVGSEPGNDESSEKKAAPAFHHSAVNGKTEEEEEQNAAEAPVGADAHAQGGAIDTPSASMASAGTDAELEALRRELSLLRHGIDAAEMGIDAAEVGLEHAALEAELSLSDIGEEDVALEQVSSVVDSAVISEHPDEDDKDASTDNLGEDVDAAKLEQLASSQEELGESGAASEEGATPIRPRHLGDEYDKEMKVSTKTTSILSAQEDDIPEGDGRDNGADIIIRQLRRERDELRARAERLESELLASEERAAALERERDEMVAAVETMVQQRKEDDRTTEALKEKVRELEATLEKKDDGEDSKAGRNRLVVEPVVAEDTKASRAA